MSAEGKEMKGEKYYGWEKDPRIAKKYLLEFAKIQENKIYGFFFEDGTGMCGTIDMFIPYLIRRFKWNPDGYFEIYYNLQDEVPAIIPGEICPPLKEGEIWVPGRRDDRF